jgi:hypothetical protein
VPVKVRERIGPALASESRMREIRTSWLPRDNCTDGRPIGFVTQISAGR